MQKSNGRVYKLPPIEKWNQILLRFVKQYPDFTIGKTKAKEIAEVLRISKKEVSELMKRPGMSQPKLIQFMRKLRNLRFSTEDIYDIVAGPDLTKSGIWKVGEHLGLKEGEG